MAIAEPAREQVPQAEVRIPADWLMPWLDLNSVQEAQRPDSLATLTSEELTISGVEVVVERRWLREPHWRDLKHAVRRGYIYRTSGVQVTLRGERRERERRSSPLR
jgi:hypothetical protein